MALIEKEIDRIARIVRETLDLYRRHPEPARRFRVDRAVDEVVELLESLCRAAQTGRGIPVILVTGYPSLDTAIGAIDLSVVGYLVKPIDFDQFLARVRTAISGSRVTRALREVRERLHTWREDVLSATDVGVVEAQGLVAHRALPVAFDVFLATTSRTIMDCLADMRHLAEALAGAGRGAEPCHLLNCPRLRQFRQVAVETIEVLEQTKTAFKSRQLGEVRQKLEDLMRELSEQSA